MKKRRAIPADPDPEDCIRMARLCLSASLRRTERVVTRHYDAHLATSGVTAVQLPMLAMIAAMEEASFRSLSEGLDLDRSTLSRNLALLREKRLVTIGPSSGPKPGRIALTARGRTALREAYALWTEAQDEIEKALSGGEAVTGALALLKTIRRAVRTTRT